MATVGVTINQLQDNATVDDDDLLVVDKSSGDTRKQTMSGLKAYLAEDFADSVAEKAPVDDPTFTTKITTPRADVAGVSTREYNVTDNPEIAALTGGSNYGTIQEGHPAGQTVVGLRENDSNDGFHIISGNFNYDEDETWDTLVASFLANGTVKFPSKVVTTGGLPVTAQADTIADLKALNVAIFQVGMIVASKGFDAVGDGGGGLFQLFAGAAPLFDFDGIEFDSDTAGYHWKRIGLNGSVIPAMWAGVFPNKSSSATFDPDGYAANNSYRLNDLRYWCSQNKLDLITTAANIGSGSILLPSGIIDVIPYSVGGTTTAFFLDEGVCVYGTGKASCCLRMNSLAFGSVISMHAGADYGFGATLQGFTVFNMAVGTKSSSNFGINIKNVVRGACMRDVAILNFGKNFAFEDQWEFECYNCDFIGAQFNNVNGIGDFNSLLFQGCRMDDCTGTDNIYLDDSASNAAQLVAFRNCAIQRSQQRAIFLKGVRNFVIDGCQFEGNNRADDSSPDVWVEGPVTIVGRILGNYFTTTGRNGATTSRAVNVRSNVLAGSIFVIKDNIVADNTFGTFIDIDANVALKLHSSNRNIVGSVASSVPGNVLQY